MRTPRRIVVIGGSAAGPKTAARARRLDQNAEITIVQKARHLSMASCGYPYYVGGTFDDRNNLLCTPTGVLRDPEFFADSKDIRAETMTEALSVNREEKTVRCRRLESGDEFVLSYDKLVITTGAIPIIPPLPGRDLDGVTTLQSMEDAEYLRRVRDEGKVRRAVIVGGGLIGVETCEALRLAGIEATVIEMLPQVLAFLDWEMAKILENHMKLNGVHIELENPVDSFLGENGKLSAVKLKSGTELPCELAVIATGVRPNTVLASEAGLEIGRTGGIVVDEHMRTSDPNVYAAGDCVEIPHIITGNPVHAPFGDLANIQGRVVGTNIVRGDTAVFNGTLLTGVCKVFEYSVGATGLSEKVACELGYDTVSVLTAAMDKPGFMGAKILFMKLVADRASRKLLGVQCLGPGDASKRIAEAAVALHGGLKIDDLAGADLPYAPPFSPAMDNLIAGAHVLENKFDGLIDGISCSEVRKRTLAGEAPFLLDTRSPEEYVQMRLGIGEVLIPLEALRKRLDDLPEDKDCEIVCFCKVSIRGYEAARILQARGYGNVKVMEGGIMAWPFPREK